MAIPVINLTTSILEPDQWRPYFYQPYATNAPTSWTCTSLPPGMTFDATYGTIAGTPTVAGVAVASLAAVNADGTSTPVLIYIGVAPAQFSSPNKYGMNVTVDLSTGAVSFDGKGAPQIIEGEDVLFFVQFMSGDTAQDYLSGGVDMTAFQIGLKELEPDPLIQMGSAFIKSGSGASATYILYISATSNNIAAALSNYEADTGTSFSALAGLKWTVPNPTGVGPNPMQRASRLFNLEIVRNVV
jgi:hypothetical protein